MVCVKKRGRRGIGGTWWWWWWDEDVKEAISRKKDAQKLMHSTEENLNRYKSMKNKARKVFNPVISPILRVARFTSSL